MDVLSKTIGKYLFAIPFLIFGVFHFMSAGDMAGMVPGWIPGGVFWIYLTGIALIAAAVSMVINFYDKLGAFLLGVMLLIFALTIHLPGALEGNQLPMTMLLKDLAMAGGAWIYAGYVAQK